MAASFSGMVNKWDFALIQKPMCVGSVEDALLNGHTGDIIAHLFYYRYYTGR